jgi:hypothetical protein
MGRTKPRTVSELMDIANRFADGEDAYHYKRTLSPEYDRPHRYSNQRRRSCNYDNHNSHNQVAARYKGNNSEGEERRNMGPIIETIQVATDSSDPGIMTRHPKKYSMDHAICTTPMSTEIEFQTI